MSLTTSSPLLAPKMTLRIDSVTGGAFGLVAEAAWKPDERNVVISSLQFASAPWASWIRNLTTTSFKCFCSWTAFLPPSTAAALAATKASVGRFQRRLIDRLRRRTGVLGIVVRRTRDIHRRRNDSVRRH